MNLLYSFLMISGSIVALITPFRQGVIDYNALESLLNFQIASGTHGVVVCGSTGEGMLLSLDEHKKVVEFAKEIVGTEMFLITGCTGVSYEHTSQLIQNASNIILMTPPPYIRPSQEGIIDYFKHIHDKTYKDIIVYNNPQRCGVDMSIDTIEALFDLPRIIGLKDSNTDLLRISALRRFSDKSLLCGEDLMIPAYLVYGGKGCISVCGNIIPQEMVKLMHAMKCSFDLFYKQAEKILNIVNILSKGANPSAIKFLLSLFGKCKNELRFPLTPIENDIETKMKVLFDDCQSYFIQ